jgi:predicted dehydrogenase
MLESGEIEAVLLLNGIYNVDCAIAAAKRGIHIFVEKPMAMTFSQADAIIEAKNAAGVQVMVGYMRRYAPAFLQAAEEVKNMEKINYVKVRDIIGYNHFFSQQSSKVRRFNDIPDIFKNDLVQKRAKLLDEAVGEFPEEFRGLYGLLTGLSSHSTSSMREIIGMPKGVASAVYWDNSFLNVVFEYDKFYAVYEMGLDNQRRFDANIEIFGDKKTVKVQYNTPYIRSLPVQLMIGETEGEGYSERVIRHTYRDPFCYELEYFYNSIISGTEPKTNPEDARKDLEIFEMIMKAIKER